MAGTITVDGRASLSNVQAVMWAIAELGRPCDWLRHGHSFGGMDSPGFRAMNLHGLVPVIRDGDRDHEMLSFDMLRAKGA